MDVLSVMREDRVVAVIRAERVHDPISLVAALTDAGIRTVEFTFTIPYVGEVIEAAAASSDGIIGAGTVITRTQGEEALRAGARFLVAPTLAPQLMGLSDEPVILGAFTPTEIQGALEAGAAAVKLFPARIGGPDYLRDLAGPFPNLALIPSGGVSEANARDYLEAGALAVYAGSSLAPAKLVESGDHVEINRRAKAFVAALH